ncbi:MAG: right-handed parallel beta-helix repeat-containing protein [Candidatus Thorarchaeota archaeon]
MIRKSIPVFLIVLLSLQTFIVTSSYIQWTLVGSSEINQSKRAILSQGSRLNPEDYSNHVPISIDELSDFDLFGLPGAGTQEDPYLISSFNITNPIDYDAIKIADIDAYVTIVDCFIDQETNEYGINLVNTSHITVEYVTIESIGGGIYCLNANNTQIKHCEVIVDVMAVSIDNSNECYLFGNYLKGVSATCNVIGSTAFVSENNVYQASVIGSSLILVMANDSRSTSDYFDTPATSVTVSLSANFIISDANITGVFGGLIIDGSDSPIVTRCTISTEDNPGFGAFNCPNILVNESTISSITGDGIYVVSSNYTQILDNTIPQSGFSGIYVGDSFQSNVARNYAEAGYVSIYLVGCEQSIITLNEVTSDVIGAGMEECNNSAITFNYAHDIGMVAFVSDDNFNISVNDNIVENATRGGIVANIEDKGFGLEVCRNVFSNIKWWTISASDYENVVIKNNSISVLEGEVLWFDEGQGIRLKECDDIEIEGNHIWDGITGIATASCVNMTIESNIIEDMILTGIGGVNNVNTNITDNIVENCDAYGVALGMFVDTGQAYRGPPSGLISGNNLSGCGFFTDFDSFSQFEDHTYTDNVVNSKPLFFGVNMSNQIIDADLYGQVIIFNCSYVNITSSDYIFDNAITHILYSSQVLVENIQSQSKYESLFIYLSQNITISNYTGEYMEVYELLVGWNLPSVQILQSTNVLIENSVFAGIGENTAILTSSSLYTTIKNCTIYDMSIGVRIDDSENCTLFGNHIIKMKQGIRSTYSGGYYEHGLSIIENEIRHGSEYGIYIENTNADRGLIKDNTIESCWIGIHLEDGVNWTIQNNVIRWNKHYGIYLNDATGANISYNTVGFSGTANGFDDQTQNWDDNVSLGNYWYDYTPPGVYPISGGAGAQDRYPQQYLVTEPIIDELLDLSYAEGTTDNVLTWHPVDDSLRDWQVTIDGTLWAGDAWNLENITVNVDGLSYGVHTLVVTVWDVSQNNVTDVVLIHVFDGTPPVIDGPPDTIAFEDGTGQTLTWDISDLHPDTYQIYLNAEEVESGTWTSGEFQYLIDGLTAGLYTISMTIFDIDGNEATDSAMVQVFNDDDDPSIDSPDDITFDYGIGGHQIVWTAEDAFPSRYELSMNGSVVLTEDWSGSRIVVDLTGLEVGTYYFGVTVYDGSGRSASDEVRVTVLRIIGEPVTTPDQPIDFTMLLTIGAGIGAVVVIVAVLYIFKKRKSG